MNCANDLWFSAACASRVSLPCPHSGVLCHNDASRWQQQCNVRMKHSRTCCSQCWHSQEKGPGCLDRADWRSPPVWSMLVVDR